MAGDWIKIEKSTPRKPEVLHLCDLLSITPDEAFGLCFRFWSWCDDHLETGCASRVTESMIDVALGRNGMASALITVGWLQVRQGSLVIPNFDRHLSESAKKRALSGKRMAKKRLRNSYADSVTKAQPEKRREEKRRDTSIDVSIDPLTPIAGDGEISADAGSKSPPDPSLGKQIPPELSDWLAWWNGLAARKLVPHRVDAENPSEAVLKNWGRSRKDARQVERLESRELVEAMIIRSPFCKEPWFRLEKLLYGKNGDGEFILVKLLDGGYAGGRNERAGVGVADHDPNATPRVF